MSVLLHLSDPHFGTEQPPVLEALLAFAHELKPQLCVLSGDITQRAKRAEFRAARAFRDRLGVLQTLVIPGNHDIPLYNLIARIFTPYRAYSRAFGNELEGIIDSRDFLLITVNTTRRWRHVQGAVSAAQIERVVQRLRAASDQQLRVVVTHQPLHVTRAEDEKNLLRNGAAAARAWAQAGADLVLGGHIHLPYVRALSERFSDLPRELWCAQAGTSVSKRVRYGAPNSVNVIRSIAAKEFMVEQWDYAASRGRFLKAHSTVIALSR